MGGIRAWDDKASDDGVPQQDCHGGPKEWLLNDLSPMKDDILEKGMGPPPKLALQKPKVVWLDRITDRLSYKPNGKRLKCAGLRAS
jgi:hypothetical protein